MRPLSQTMKDYVSMRRNLGFTSSTTARVLSSFIEFAGRERADHVTTALVLRWAKQSRNALPSTRAARVGIVRRFARWLTAFDPRTEVPPAGLFPHRLPRNRPYIYTDLELDRILRAARHLPSANGLRAPAYTTFFSLLAVTGMRVSEAAALTRADVDLDAGIVTVRATKFSKNRIVPLHPTACRALDAYARQRDRVLGSVDTDAFFTYGRDLGITDYNARHNWVLVCRKAGVRNAAVANRRGHGPRIHDLRHRFAARTLFLWYRRGLDVEREMPKLVTYLGHAGPEHTYWYLEVVPELLQLASRRLKKQARR